MTTQCCCEILLGVYPPPACNSFYDDVTSLDVVVVVAVDEEQRGEGVPVPQLRPDGAALRHQDGRVVLRPGRDGQPVRDDLPASGMRNSFVHPQQLRPEM